jgi:uncharacterized protein (DUF4415 family)
MNAKNLKDTSKTDWSWLESETDHGIDYTDIPLLADSFFENAQLWQPQRMVSITLHVEPDVLAWFKAQGDKYERRINAALRIYVEAHKEQEMRAVDS